MVASQPNTIATMLINNHPVDETTGIPLCLRVKQSSHFLQSFRRRNYLALNCQKLLTLILVRGRRDKKGIWRQEVLFLTRISVII